jgi:hypothetical protein
MSAIFCSVIASNNQQSFSLLRKEVQSVVMNSKKTLDLLVNIV